MIPSHFGICTTFTKQAKRFKILTKDAKALFNAIARRGAQFSFIQLSVVWEIKENWSLARAICWTQKPRNVCRRNFRNCAPFLFCLCVQTSRIYYHVRIQHSSFFRSRFLSNCGTEWRLSMWAILLSSVPSIKWVKRFNKAGVVLLDII